MRVTQARASTNRTVARACVSGYVRGEIAGKCNDMKREGETETEREGVEELEV